MRLGAFIDRSVTPEHMAAAAIERLRAAGFAQAPSEGDPGPGKHYVLHGGRTLFAWIARGRPEAVHLVAAHTDFPALRVKPDPFFVRNGALFLAIHPYDGPSLASWMDRELALAGTVWMEGAGGVTTHSIKPDLTVRTIGLPPHMRAEPGPPNAQTDMHAFLGTADGLDRDAAWKVLLRGSGLEGVPLEHDLWLHDATPARRIGADGDIVSAPRLDNLVSAHSALEALETAEASDGRVPMLALFDAEELGSGTWLGAKGPLLERLLRRIAEDRLPSVLTASAQISLDVAHAVHPLSPELFDSAESPRIGRGPVAKYGLRANYSYDAGLMAHLRHLARLDGTELQSFTYRADRGQGGSLGPHSSTALGIRSIDAGVPIFAMHAIREAASRADIEAATNLLSRFYATALPGA